MTDIIHLLPDSVANQIAAGEVIQRPSSIVKELVENSIDAGATVVQVVIRDAGKNLVQVIDNGCGMSETDARLSFERHATSKIKTANDLFAIQTMGFRGEALASVAAIAEVEMQTRQPGIELGTLIEIKGSGFIRQEPVSCPPGCIISVKNLFFNIPARRKFLKTNNTEIKHIISEFQRIALGHPSIEFSLHNEGSRIIHLPPSQRRQRLGHLFGKQINQQLIEIDTNTRIIDIKGYIAKPEFARKSPGEQFFFLNKRFMKHPYFHKAIVQAFEKILQPGTIPSYFIWFEADPSTIDINIHPTKTEIKFENEQAIWQILNASVRESLGKFNIIPSIDFNTDGMIDIPVRRSDYIPAEPVIPIDPDYNPFRKSNNLHSGSDKQGNIKKWFENREELIQSFESKRGAGTTETGNLSEYGIESDSGIKPDLPSLVQIKNRYILSPVKSGLMIIDQKRAHERILYERFLKKIKSGTIVAQQQLYPVTLELEANEYNLIKELIPELANFGFDIRDFGHRSVLISGCPAETIHVNPQEMIMNLLSEYKNSGNSFHENPNEKIARDLARSSAINYGKTLDREEMQELVDKLFGCSTPNFSPDGKPVITIMSNEEIDKKFTLPG